MPMKLIHTPPQLPPGWNGSSLYSNNITLLWSATQKLLGSFWQTRLVDHNYEEVHDPTEMDTDQMVQESSTDDNEDQEQIELSDASISDNESLQSNISSTTPKIQLKSPGKTYESLAKKAKTDVTTDVTPQDKSQHPTLPNP